MYRSRKAANPARITGIVGRRRIGLYCCHESISLSRAFCRSPRRVPPDRVGCADPARATVQRTPALDRARLFVAGPVLAPKSPDEARKLVDEDAAMKVDIVKIRVDDNLGATQKMAPEIYKAVIDQAHKKGLRVAVHLFYLDDAKSVLDAGADFIAHSVRDVAVDDAFAAMLKRRDVCYCPTLMREVSTFVYEATPAWFADPLFLKHTDAKVLD